MPGVPPPIVDPRLGQFWTPVVQGAKLQQAKAGALAAGATQGNLVDQYGNTVQVAGTNLDQAVTIGASHGRAGVLVGTGIANGTPGTAVQQNLTTGTITVTAGSTSATLTPTTAPVTVGMVIGAADDSGIPAIVPGTTVTSVSGASITLSQNAAGSGSGLYCAACNFISPAPSVTPAAAAYFTTSVTTFSPATVIASWSANWTRGGMVVSSSGITIPVSGIYRVAFNARFDPANTSTWADLQLWNVTGGGGFGFTSFSVEGNAPQTIQMAMDVPMGAASTYSISAGGSTAAAGTLYANSSWGNQFTVSFIQP